MQWINFRQCSGLEKNILATVCIEGSSPDFVYTYVKCVIGRLLGFPADYGGKLTQAFKIVSIYYFYYIFNGYYC